MKRMGLFGGTFDPIHQGHVDMALKLAAELSLDGVVLMPTALPPHKVKESMASAADRLAMCRLVAADNPLFTVSDMELTREGASFTVDTLTALHAQCPDTLWHLFVGADMFTTLRSWYRFGDIAKRAVIATVPREGTADADLNAYADTLRSDGIRCYVADSPVMAVSSTAIRRRIAAGESLQGMVPQPVATYITEKGLYRQRVVAVNRHEQFKEILKTRLTPARYHHSLCVAEEAARLAEKYGADREKAYTAGLVHDIMKDTDQNTQLQILQDFGILLDEVERQGRQLWHQKTGEAFLRHVLHLEDEAILTAVRYHTTGRAGMSLLEQVLFVADFTSADRDYPDIAQMRRLADVSLVEAMRYGVSFTLKYLVDRDSAIHPDTVALYNEIVLATKSVGRLAE